MAPRKLKPGDLYTGPKAILTDEDGLTAHWAISDKGEPLARLVQIDLAPGDPDDGSEEYRVAGPDDPAQSRPDNLVELEVDEIHGSASTEA
jgi:hypothetical protein